MGLKIKLDMLTPEYILDFGKHKGYKLSDVYKFCPDYLEWAITHVEDFIIDLTLFEHLPKPTPYKKYYPVKLGEHETKTFKPSESDIPYAYKAIKNGEVIKEVNYKFPAHIIEINEKKQQGQYEVPDWTPLNKREALTVDGLLKKELPKDEDLVCLFCGATKKQGCRRGRTDCNTFNFWVRKRNI